MLNTSTLYQHLFFLFTLKKLHFLLFLTVFYFTYFVNYTVCQAEEASSIHDHVFAEIQL